MMVSKRNQFIDLVKGVAIFLMLWGHCIQCCVTEGEVDFFENNVFKFIYSFHMPLFMLVSGYLFFTSFSKRSLNELLIHRTQALLQPIVFCSFFNFLMTTVLFEAMQGNFSAVFDGGWMNNLSSLWFLWSVLVASLAVAIVCKKANNLFIQIVLLLVFSFVIAIFPNINLNLFMYPYFILGFYFAQYKDKIPCFIYKMKYLSLVLFPILMIFYEKKHYIYTTGLFATEDYAWKEMLVIDLYRWVVGIVGSVFVITILQLVYQHITLKLKKPVLSKALTRIGEKSLQIYAFSVPFLSAYLSTFSPKVLSTLNINYVFTDNMIIYNFVFTLILAVIYAFVLYYIIKLFERIKLSRIMFGK